jgi:hypothetical protein
MQTNDRLDTPPARSGTGRVAGGDWLSVLLIAAFLILALSQASLSFRSLGVGLAIFVVAVTAIIAGVAAYRRLALGDRPHLAPDAARMERLRILENVLHDNESDADLKRRALEAIISETQP